MTPSNRAEPMPPDARRRAIVDAVIPLLLEQGAAVTTRQMAEAAGVAEGTIFRVFPDKCAVIHEAVKVSMDPEPTWTALAEIDPRAAFDEQLRAAVSVMLRRLDDIVGLMGVLRTVPGGPSPDASGPPAFVAEANAAVIEALTGFFERHSSVLAVDPRRAAMLFRALVIATGHPGFGVVEPSTDEIVDVLLNGIVQREAAR